MGTFKVFGGAGGLAVAAGALMIGGGSAVAAMIIDDTDRTVAPNPPPATQPLEADGIAYCGQQDREAPCQPKFYRQSDGRIFHVVNSPAYLEALAGGYNLRVHLTGDIVLDTVFGAERIRVKNFDVRETLQGGQLNPTKQAEPGPGDPDRPRFEDR